MINTSYSRLTNLITNQQLPSIELIQQAFILTDLNNILALPIQIASEIQVNIPFYSLYNYYTQLSDILHINIPEKQWYSLYLTLRTNNEYSTNSQLILNQYNHLIPLLHTSNIFYQFIEYSVKLYMLDIEGADTDKLYDDIKAYPITIKSMSFTKEE